MKFMFLWVWWRKRRSRFADRTEMGRMDEVAVFSLPTTTTTTSLGADEAGVSQRVAEAPAMGANPSQPQHADTFKCHP